MLFSNSIQLTVSNQYSIAQDDLETIKFIVLCLIQVKGFYYSSLFALGPRANITLLMTEK